MIESKYLRVNTPNVVHETIDGEAILLDLKTGNYFSLDGPGAIIWDYIANTGDWRKAIDLIVQNQDNHKESIILSVEKFIAELVEEALLVPVKDDSGFSKDDITAYENNLITAGVDFVEPLVNKYSDMQDLLLLDPIHDVDDKGWPEAKDIIPEEPVK